MLARTEVMTTTTREALTPALSLTAFALLVTTLLALIALAIG
jgi:hypothetical protein